MRKQALILGALLLLPLAATAADQHCEHSQPRNLQLDMAGVKTVVFEVGANDLDVRAAATPGNAVEGRACASREKDLSRLVLSQRKSGDKLVVTAEREGKFGGFSLFGSHYAYMKLRASVPDDVAVQLEVGSGDASIDGAASARIDIGSGDVRATRVRGELAASLGSGDLEASDIGSLDLGSVGSGDASIRNVGGTSRIGSVGSGDVSIRSTRGPVDVGSVGSGDLDFEDIGGSITVGSIGSGDIEVDGARGDLTVRSAGSGDIDHSGVTGRVDLPRRN